MPAQVSPSDITFIAAWIDDGCPETDGASNAVASKENHQRSWLRPVRSDTACVGLGDALHTVSKHCSEDQDSVNGLKSEEVSTRRRQNGRAAKRWPACIQIRYYDNAVLTTGHAFILIHASMAGAVLPGTAFISISSNRLCRIMIPVIFALWCWTDYSMSIAMR